jgi:hypothetical protein
MAINVNIESDDCTIIILLLAIATAAVFGVAFMSRVEIEEQKVMAIEKQIELEKLKAENNGD